MITFIIAIIIWFTFIYIWISIKEAVLGKPEPTELQILAADAMKRTEAILQQDQ